MAEYVVDDLETVQIDVQHCQVRQRGLLQACLDLEADRVAVEQAGQRVGACLDAQDLLALLALGDVLQGAGKARAERATGVRLADDPGPERRAALAESLDVELQALASGRGMLQCLAQASAVGLDQAAVEFAERGGRSGAAEDAAGLQGQVELVAAGVPFPATDVRECLGAVEQGTVALELGHVGVHRQHLVRRRVPRQEFGHRRDRQPGERPPAAVEIAQHRGFHGTPGMDGAGGRLFGRCQLAAIFVHHRPLFRGQGLCGRFAGIDSEQAHRRCVDVRDVSAGIPHQDGRVDGFHQQAIALFGVSATAEVTGYGDDTVAALVVERRRMHLDREAGAVGPHVVDLDHIGPAAVERLPDRRQVVVRQVRVEHVDGLSDDLFARALVSGQACPVEVEHGAVMVEDADRIGHGVEQGVVAQPRRFGIVPRGLQGGPRLSEKRMDPCRKVLAEAGFLQCRERRCCIRPVGRWRHAGHWRPVGHDTASAFPARLPVSRPSRPASQRPVAASSARSMPVVIPIPCSM